MVAHDVSRELRGYHGKWTSGGALKRVVDSAAVKRGGKSVEDHKAAIDELKPGQARGVNGIKVTHMGDKGYRVTMPGETRHYASSHDAARAAHGKAHVEPGAAPGKAPEFTPERWKAAQAEAKRKALSAEGGKSPEYYPPAPEHRPYEHTPETALRDMVTRGGNEAATKELTSRLLANEKTRVEAENAARFGPNRGLQEYGNKMGGVPAKPATTPSGRPRIQQPSKQLRQGLANILGVNPDAINAANLEQYKQRARDQMSAHSRRIAAEAKPGISKPGGTQSQKQARLAEAASRRGITNRRKMA